MIFHFLAPPKPQEGGQSEEDETPQGETAAIRQRRPYVYFKQKSSIRKYLSDAKPLDLSFKVKGLQPIKIQWREDSLELTIGSRYQTISTVEDSCWYNRPLLSKTSLLFVAFTVLSFSCSLACAHIPVVSAPGILDQEVRHNLAIFSWKKENNMQVSSALTPEQTALYNIFDQN